MFMKCNSRKLFLFFCVAVFFAFSVQAQTTIKEVKTGKNPVIIIPGLTGSELINRKTGETVWFKPARAKDDDIRLPISSLNLAQNKDSLVAGDVIRNVQLLKFLPEVEIYEKLIDALQTRGGYTEGKWDKPPAKGFEDTFYVFGYDWRLDNVENARLLVRKIEDLKRKLKRPNLKFNVIAHSMGGLLARYAAMYGNADLPSGKPRPTWAGSRHFGKVFLLGTPNEGSAQALESLIYGFDYIGGGLNLPFVQNISKFDTFTIPSIYQLLPHSGTFTVYDENLKPLEIDIFNPKTWDEYGWSVIKDDDFKKNFTPAEQKNARAYFEKVLKRAKRFHEALGANVNEKTSVQMYLIGANCRDTLDAAVIYRDKKGKWKTIFKADGFESANGVKVSSEEIKKILYVMGDGVVAKRSLATETLAIKANKTVLPITSEIYLCEGHTKLVTSTDVQDKLFAFLLGNAEVKAQK
jgi:pimeloyl-ACP methyl ester carboxylesterase